MLPNTAMAMEHGTPTLQALVWMMGLGLMVISSTPVLPRAEYCELVVDGWVPAHRREERAKHGESAFRNGFLPVGDKYM